jgi:uncharacterized protein DUF1570
MKIKTIAILFILCGICRADLSKKASYESGVCNFNLYDCKLTSPVEKAIVYGVERILFTYKDLFGFPYPDDFMVNVTIINSKEDFLEYQKKHIGRVISQTGYFSGGNRETVVWANTSAEEMLGVLFHESSHMILMHELPGCPMWLNEGLSEYFEGLNVIGKKKRVNLQQNRHSWMKSWARTKMPVPLDVYLDLNYDQWQELNKKDSNAAYTIGYEVTYFLMSNSRNLELLKKMLNQFRLFGNTVKTVQMINVSYPGGFKKFEERWMKWIPRARKYRPLRALKKPNKKQIPTTVANPDKN